MFKNTLKLFTLVLTIFSTLHAPIASAEIEKMPIYGTKHTAMSLWLFLRMEHEYRYEDFQRDIQNDAHAALVKACDAANGKQPEDCEERPTASAAAQTDGCTNAPDFDFTGACNAHDVCYNNVSTSQASCDDAFLANMDQACNDVYGSGFKHKLCEFAAEAYHKTVKKIGSEFYSE
ncbi:MAG: hypothetical protein HRT35_36560, partial [Algicola sp.]|nr:hypothetical protein [Algicola sp.]